jgi:hypothetical protein
MKTLSTERSPASSANLLTSASTRRPRRSKRRSWPSFRRGSSPPLSSRGRRSGAPTTAPGNGAPIGGLTVVTPIRWFAARSSGTKDVYKLYAEGFKAQAVIRKAFEDERISQ